MNKGKEKQSGVSVSWRHVRDDFNLLPPVHVTFDGELNEQPIEHALTIPERDTEIQLLVETDSGHWAFPVMIPKAVIEEQSIYKKPYRVRLKTGGYWGEGNGSDDKPNTRTIEADDTRTAFDDAVIAAVVKNLKENGEIAQLLRLRILGEEADVVSPRLI